MSENPVQVEEGATTLDFSGVTVIGLPATGLISINGDTTPAQTLAGDINPTNNDSSIIVTDLGGGGHTLKQWGIYLDNALFVPVVVPPGVLTSFFPGGRIFTHGIWFLTANLSFAGPLPSTINSLCQILVNGNPYAQDVRTTAISANVNAWGVSMATGAYAAVGNGDPIDLVMIHDGQGPLTVLPFLDGFRIGDY